MSRMVVRSLLILLAALAALAASACSNPPYPRGNIEKIYPQPPRPMLHDVSIDGRNIHLAEMLGKGGTPLLFVHGSPGDWQAWSAYLDAPALANYGARVAVDRPGFGGSGAGAVMPNLRQQAGLLAQLAPPGPPAIIIGHSLGGPLLAWMLLDHPEQFCGGVMVAGSIAPALEAPRWYNRLADTWLAQQLMPDELIWSNHEIMPLQSELQKLDAKWPQLARPLVLVQGETDELVDPRTADYAERRIPAALLTVVRVPKQGHFVLWDQPQIVIDAIKRLPCADQSLR